MDSAAIIDVCRLMPTPTPDVLTVALGLPKSDLFCVLTQSYSCKHGPFSLSFLFNIYSKIIDLFWIYAFLNKFQSYPLLEAEPVFSIIYLDDKVQCPHLCHGLLGKGAFLSLNLIGL